MKTFKKLTHHIFVCTNERPPDEPRGCCRAKGSEEILKAFKDELTRVGARGTVRAQKSGCLDTCEAGPAVVVYPENIWYGAVSLEDVQEIVNSHIVGGVPVERLKIPGK